jgi:hypothetical protein
MIDLPIFFSTNMLLVASVFVILSVILAYFLFRNTMNEGDFERVLEFYDGKRMFDFKFIGIDKFWNTPMDRPPIAIPNSNGKPQYIIDSRNPDGSINMAWSTTVSVLRFMRDKKVNESLLKKFKKTLFKYLALRPQIFSAGSEIGEFGLNSYERVLGKRSFSLDLDDDTDAVLDKIDEMIDNEIAKHKEAQKPTEVENVEPVASTETATE